MLYVSPTEKPHDSLSAVIAGLLDSLTCVTDYSGLELCGCFSK